MKRILSIKDPIHGTIELNELESRIIDCADFQRLRKIRQLATAYLVYPGANHTRFEHSLGTLHLASKIAEKLELDEEVMVKVRLHALLHDIGHGAFSHESERILSKHFGNHEQIGKEKIMKGKIGETISENFGKKEIAGFDSFPHSKIISSDMGADRMDYLKRDAYYTGVAYGVIDEERITSRMHFENSELWVDEGALEASESLLVARFMMFSTVYLHHAVRIASAMLARAIGKAIDEGLEPKLFLENGDAEMLALISGKKGARKYVDALESRKLHKQAYSTNARRVNEKNADKIEKELSELSDCEVIVDVAQNFFKPTGFRVGLHNGIKEEVGKISELVAALEKAEESRKTALVLAPSEYREKVGNVCADYFAR